MPTKQRSGIRTKTEIVHKFTDAEFREKSKELSNKMQGIEQSEAEHKAAAAVAKSRIKLLKAEVNALRMQLDNGFENVIVDSLVVMDRKKGEKTFYRYAPGKSNHDEKLKTEAMTEADFSEIITGDEPEAQPGLREAA